MAGCPQAGNAKTAVGQKPLHGLEALGLLVGDPLGQAADGPVVGVLQEVPAHPDGGLVVGDHLDDEVVGEAPGELGGGDALDHLVQNLVVAA